MDLQHPFSTAFGPASTRDECINSAEAVYNRLLKLSPESILLSFDVLQVLAESDDGTVDFDRRKHLKQLFRPDAYNELPRLAFIQSCDTVYKKLRYFRASVGNSSVIDRVLEGENFLTFFKFPVFGIITNLAVLVAGIINMVFFFLLLLMVLSLINLNPWPLLVSLSTLLVTFAFAVGPSISKAIEVRIFEPYSSSLSLVSSLICLLFGRIALFRESSLLLVDGRYVSIDSIICIRICSPFLQSAFCNPTFSTILGTES
jgi:hypothetical protein